MLPFASANAVGPIFPNIAPAGPSAVISSFWIAVDFIHSLRARSAFTKERSMVVTLSTSLMSRGAFASSVTNSIVTPSYDLSRRNMEPDSTSISDETCCSTSVFTPLLNSSVNSSGVLAAYRKLVWMYKGMLSGRLANVADKYTAGGGFQSSGASLSLPNKFLPVSNDMKNAFWPIESGLVGTPAALWASSITRTALPAATNEAIAFCLGSEPFPPFS